MNEEVKEKKIRHTFILLTYFLINMPFYWNWNKNGNRKRQL